MLCTANKQALVYDIFSKLDVAERDIADGRTKKAIALDKATKKSKKRFV